MAPLPRLCEEADRIWAKGFQQVITLRHLRALVSLSDLKLLAPVSEALGVTQSAVSKQIAELDKIAGVPVVTRDRNRLYLTPTGVRLAEHTRLALSQLDRAEFDIEAMTSGVTGSVSVGVVSSVAPTLLPGTIALFKRSTPQANVSVSEGHFVELLPQPEAGALDLLIARIWQPKELDGIDQMTLFSEPVVVVAGHDHPLAQEVAVAWADVVNYPWILPHPNSVARRAVDALFATNGLAPPSNTIASLSQALNLEILRAMPALGLLPQRLAQAQARRGAIATLPLRGGFAKGYLARQSGLTADTLGIPMVWISVAVPLSMIIILIHLFARWAGNQVTEDTASQLD